MKIIMILSSLILIESKRKIRYLAYENLTADLKVMWQAQRRLDIAITLQRRSSTSV